MVRGLRWVGVSSLAVVLLGCLPKKLAAGSDAGPDAVASAAAAVPEAAPAPLAANEADVTKYPAQKADSEALVTRMYAHVRTEASPTGGTLVATLKPETHVDLVADHEGFDLVVFPDPSDGTRKLMGWTAHAVFGAYVPVHEETTDAGHPAVVDAGGATVVDAGLAKPLPAKPLDVRRGANGICPAGYAACGPFACRLSCTSDAACGLATAHCMGGLCMGPGALPCMR